MHAYTLTYIHACTRTGCTKLSNKSVSRLGVQCPQLQYISLELLAKINDAAIQVTTLKTWTLCLSVAYTPNRKSRKANHCTEISIIILSPLTPRCFAWDVWVIAIVSESEARRCAIK